MFRWIVDTLLAMPEVHRIVINTDARDLLVSHGLVETERLVMHDRRPELCGDHITANAILEDEVATLDGESYLMTHVTNPFLTAGTIRTAVAAPVPPNRRRPSFLRAGRRGRAPAG